MVFQSPLNTLLSREGRFRTLLRLLRCCSSCFFLLGLISGCASVSGAPGPHSEDQIHIIKGVPFYPQEDYQCGPAALAAVLNYRGVDVVPDDVARDIYSKSAKGTLGIDMVFYAQSKGLEASWYSGGLEDLRKNIDAGQPLIVLVDLGFSLFQANHFMVVIGYNEGGLIVHSGKEENKFVPLADFLKSWEKTKFQTLVIKNKK